MQRIITTVRASRAAARLGALALASTLVLAPGAARAEFVNVLTGGTSGVYYPLGVAISKVIGEKVPGTRPSVQATKASVENLNLIEQGKGEVAFTLADSLADGAAGKEEAGFKAPLTKVVALGGIYPNYIQIVASKDSGIKSIADLKGKRISVGAPKSGTELNARAILGAAGIKYSDLGKLEYLPFAESVELMKNRQLDATLQSAGLGVASIKDLANSVPIVVVEVPPAVIEKIGAPYLKATIPANTYEGQVADVATAAVPNFLVTRSSMKDDDVYAITKAIYDNLPELAAAHAAARGIKVGDAMKGSPVAFHPGAARYFKEKGVTP
ncbi:TAXI family TRAP transporter solute-binding subunit [Xanthobacter dioxanivorans]|uniref:TAXI family TRAP transporter solute-binding subunit n=1 Tax=Xanthobacter dioxanivorans TaxID=2528964 RepID=A0A974PM90_9HYPH|nr:TAXI family TRAP transporter solute-binding subunit [Xanthobacter dioxanivorans]QRG06212.1 TAXI family TRAP transporter solute-binding subunit [Xanthobacter dioxanivorans]